MSDRSADGEVTWRFAGRIAIILIAVAVGYVVAAKTVGFYPTPINHCPAAEDMVCPSSNPRNLLPSLVGGVVGVVVLAPTMYAFNQVVGA